MSISDDTQERLLDAAGQVFAEKGFEKATVRAILDRAGIKNIAAVNYYFGDKEALYRHTLESAFKCRAEQMTFPQWLADTPGLVKLREVIRTIVLHMCAPRQPWQMQVLMRELSGPSEAGADLVRRFIRPVYEALWEVLREVLPADISEEKMHLIAFSIIGQSFYHRVGRPVMEQVVGAKECGQWTPERLADHIAEFSIQAVSNQRSAVSKTAKVR
jgi:AcrR family transcriptional regulator